MTKNQKYARKKSAPSPNGRPTIGFFTGNGEQFLHLMWCGIADVARARNINALCFVGQAVYDYKGKAQANILYDLVDVEQLDGLVIWGLMCKMLDPDQTRQFYERYRPLPIVSVAQPMAGITNMVVDNYGGMRQAIAHLIEVHGCRRIAYIKGLPNFQEHDDRYRAYLDVLAEYGLPFDPARVATLRDTAETEQSDWGQVALCRLLDEQKAEFDALVTNDDRFAHELLPELQARGIRVPDDMALVSFDDAKGSNCLTPPLTTVPYPMYEVGRQAAETLLAQLEGQKVLERVKVPTRLIVRQSCGCLDPKVTQVVAGPVARTGAAEPLEVSLVEQRENLVAAMMRAAENAAAGLNPGWAEQLLDGFVAALTPAEAGEMPARFLSTLDDILRQVMAAEGDIEVWPQVLSTLRRQLLPYLSIAEDGALSRDRTEDLWQQAQVMIGRVGQRAQAYQDLQAEQQKRILSEIGTALTTHFDVNDLADILARELPRLGIARGYLALYENPQPYRYPQPAPRWSRLVLAYDEENPAGSSRVELEAGGRRFLSRQLAPEGILPQQGAYSLVVQALYFQNEQIGFVLLDGKQREGDVYDTLRAQISSALQGAMLVQRVQEHSAELTRQQYILDTFMENVPDSIYFKDLDSRITRANRAHAVNHGLDNPAAEIGKTDFDFFPEEQARRKFEQEQIIIRTGQPILNLEEAGGPEDWILTTKMPLRDEHGEIIGTFGISRDITALKQAQTALEQAYAEVEQQVRERTAELQDEIAERERLTTAIEQAAEAVMITDPEGNIVYVNPAFERITGYIRAEAVGQNPRMLKSGRHDPAFYQNLWSTIGAGQVWSGRLVNKKKDGTLYTEEATISPMRDEDGAIINYVAVKRDVTRELQLEEQYRQAQKMQAVGQLTAGIAHDFNNMLTVINGFAELAQHGLAADHPLQNALGKISHAGQRAARLVKQLMAFSRKQVMEPQVLNLNTVVADMDNMLRRIIGEHIALKTILASDLGLTNVDPAQLEQIIVNLAVNARDAMPRGGRLTIETVNVTLDENYAADHLEVAPGEYVLLTVSDDGVGMSEEIKAHLFEPFFTTKERGKGTGLGLATVFGIVKQSNGHIWVYSEPGQGSTFKIYLPRVQRSVTPNLPNEVQSLPVGHETILLVEDDPGVREIAVSILRQQGYAVLVASDSLAAMNLARQYDGPIDLLLTDVVMPGGNGKTLADALLQLRPNLKRLFMSGYTDETIVQHGILTPGIAFLQKPFTVQGLARKVREVLDTPRGQGDL